MHFIGSEYDQTKQVKLNNKKVSICGTNFIFFKAYEEKGKAFSCIICIFLIPLDITSEVL